MTYLATWIAISIAIIIAACLMWKEHKGDAYPAIYFGGLYLLTHYAVSLL